MMTKVSLGQLRIHSKSSGLELKLTSSIKCAAAGEAEVEQLRETLTASELNENRLPRPFIYCDNSLLFSLLLQFDPELDSEEHDCLIHEFPAKLRTATVALASLLHIRIILIFASSFGDTYTLHNLLSARPFPKPARSTLN